MLRHLLFKAWPIRCWSRKFWTVLSRSFKSYCTSGGDRCTADEHKKHARKEEERRQVEVTLNRLLLCLLLGNYPHIPASAFRPGPVLRRRLYGMLDARGHREQYNSPESRKWRSELLDRCPRVYMHALQEFMCADIVDAPALLRHVRNAMPKFDAFFSVVQHTTDRVRRMIAAAEAADFDSMSDVLENARLQILNTAYDHPHLPFLEFLREVRSFAKPDAKMWYRNGQKRLGEFRARRSAKPSSEISRRIGGTQQQQQQRQQQQEEEKDSGGDSEDDEEEGGGGEEEEEREAKLSKSERNPTSMGVLIEQAVQEGFAVAARREATAGNAGEDVLPITSMQITMAHSRVLEDWIATFDGRSTSPDDVFWTITRLMPLFGCSSLAVSEAQRLWLDYKQVKKAKDRWKSRMKLYSMRHPYAYALLQASRRFFARHRQFQVYPLPDNILQAQIQALEKRWGPGVVFAEAATIRICPCCRITNSMVRSGRTPHLNGIEGLRGVVADIASGKIYCDRSAVFAHRQCGAPDQELLKIPALGRWIGYKQRSIVLCCHCGHPTRLERAFSIYDEKGLACVNCTGKLREQQAAEWAKLHPELSSPEKFKCLLCDKALATLKKSRLFFFVAKDTFVCNRHKPGYLHKFFTELEAMVKEVAPGLLEEMFTDNAKRDHVRKLALKLRADLKDQQEKSNRRRHDYQLKLQKRADARNQRR